jgi:hypothetical protein
MKVLNNYNSAIVSIYSKPTRLARIQLLALRGTIPGRFTAEARSSVIEAITELEAVVDARGIPDAPEVAPAAERPVLANYERDAYLSYVDALRENPELANKPLRKVHAWIKEHGVEIDGVIYDLPEFGTWRKYRRAGERVAKGTISKTE